MTVIENSTLPDSGNINIALPHSPPPWTDRQTGLLASVIPNVIPRLHEESDMKQTWSRLRAYVVHVYI